MDLDPGHKAPSNDDAYSWQDAEVPFQRTDQVSEAFSVELQTSILQFRNLAHILEDWGKITEY